MKVITRRWLKSKWSIDPEIFIEFVKRFGERATVKEVVDHLHKINRPDWSAWLMGQSVQLAMSMIENGADVHASDDLTIRIATSSGRFELVKYLVDQGADVNACDAIALRWAAEKGHRDVVEYLVDKGADFRIYDDYALVIAARFGYFGVVKYLAEKGAGHIDRAYELAKQNGHPRVANWLRKKLEAS